MEKEELNKINTTLEKIERKIKDEGSSFTSFLDFNRMNEETRRDREEKRNEQTLNLQQNQTNILQNQTIFTRILAIATIILAIGTLLQLMFYFFVNDIIVINNILTNFIFGGIGALLGLSIALLILLFKSKF